MCPIIDHRKAKIVSRSNHFGVYAVDLHKIASILPTLSKGRQSSEYRLSRHEIIQWLANPEFPVHDLANGYGDLLLYFHAICSRGKHRAQLHIPQNADTRSKLSNLTLNIERLRPGTFRQLDPARYPTKYKETFKACLQNLDDLFALIPGQDLRRDRAFIVVREARKWVHERGEVKALLGCSLADLRDEGRVFYTSFPGLPEGPKVPIVDVEAGKVVLRLL